MDIIIISTGCAYQCRYWKQRLALTRGSVCPLAAEIMVVQEDWPGGAGNALGTLYAYHRACEDYGVDIDDLQRRGAAVAIYHTAGKGTRLAPLPGSERNNKSSVKLPGIVNTAEGQCILTLLEAVIRQTSAYGPYRKGRLSVFWGDQIFLPSRTPARASLAPVDILCRSLHVDFGAWERERLHQYGVIVTGADGFAQQLEKVSQSVFEQLKAKAWVDGSCGLATSLGCFSMSSQLTAALLLEFREELRQRRGKMDTDPHWWMPLTLCAEAYQLVMESRGLWKPELSDHYLRMQSLGQQFSGPMLRAEDIGSQSYWWDFGQLRHYQANILKMTQSDPEGQALCQFFGATAPIEAAAAPSLRIDAGSRLLGSRIGSGRIENSVLVGVDADHVEIRNSVVINVRAPRINCEHGLIYNILDTHPLQIEPKSVCADVRLDDRCLRFVTQIDRDGGADWEQRIGSNPLSYAQLHQLNIE